MSRNTNNLGNPNRPDPLIYASFVSTTLQERNPIALIIRDVSRAVRILANLKRNMKASEQRIQQLESQMHRVENYMDTSKDKPGGNRLNTLR